MTMNTSKFIKAFIIENNSRKFEVSVERELDLMLRNVSEEVFAKDDVAIDESVLIDLLYDDERFSALHVKINHSYFCETFSTEVMKFLTKDESNVEKYNAMLAETIEVLKKHSDSLRADLTLTKKGEVIDAEDLRNSPINFTD